MRPTRLKLWRTRDSLEEVWTELFRLFREHGYIRRPRTDLWPDRVWEERDWEVRFLLDSVVDLRLLQGLLAEAGYPAGRSGRRRGKHVQSLDGPEAVALVEELWEQFDPRRQTTPGGSPP